MSRRIALVDYGAGNLTSVRKGFAAAGAELFTPASPRELDDASAIVVPGVGHFSATSALNGEWRERILERVRAGVPLFGICLGMQWLFEGSSEAPGVPGLGLIAGTCTRLAATKPLKVPHVGWNNLSLRSEGTWLRGIGADPFVYFTHAYAAPVTPECTATTVHGVAFAAAVERGHIGGVQFHPEKSSAAGVGILRNFVELAGR